MAGSVIDLARRNAGLVRALEEGVEPWKIAHDRAEEVHRLERYFTFFKGSVDDMFEVDNHVHRISAEKNDVKILKRWVSDFQAFLKQAKAYLRRVEIRATELNAGQYQDAVLRRAAIVGLMERIEDARQVLSKWRWKN